MLRFDVTVRHVIFACALGIAIALGDSVRSKETSDARDGAATHTTSTPVGTFENTGADNCNDVSVIPLTTGPIGSPTTVIVTGDNTSATGPDCNNPSAPMWWEAFQLDEQAIITVSLSGTEPVQDPSYSFVFDKCPAEGTDRGSKIFRVSGGSGTLGCPDENIWMVFGRLDPGIYYYPVRSDGVRGSYQMQISAEALPGLSTGPDIVTGAIGRFGVVSQLGREGPIGSGTVGLGVGTTMCNKGDQTIRVLALPITAHQLIVANAYRWSQTGEVDRLEQIGQSWVKHTFGSTNSDDCSFGCNCAAALCTFEHLAPRCSDTYDADQFEPCGLGPRSAINPFTGVMPGGADLGPGGDCPSNFPASNHMGHDHPGNFGYSGIDHRLQVRDVDLIPTLNEGARYYTEGQYITPDEFISGNGNQHNNVAHREVGVSGPDGMGVFQFPLINETFSESPALDAWEGASQTVIEPAPLVDGRAILAYKVTGLGAGVWHYEYAIYNMNMDRAIESFTIPIPADAEITNIGFHAPLNHTEQANTETFSNNPWTVALTSGEVRWHTDSFAVDPQANAIRYGTLYNFRFDANAPPGSVGATIGLFKTGDSVTAFTLGPGRAPLLADPSGSDKNRFVSFVVPVVGAVEETAIAIELTTLNHRCSADSDNLFEPCNIDDDCINGVCEAPFAANEGQHRYVNTIKTCQGGAPSTGQVTCRSLDDCAMDEECLQMRMCDGTTDRCATSDDCPKGVSCLASMSCPDDERKPPFLCATTGCEPEYRDWASDLAGGVFHVYGPGIVPARSEYNLRQLPAACAGSEANCPSASADLMISTARWADLTSDGATNAADITAASDKVKEIPEALTKPRTMLIPGILDVFRKVNVSELQNTVDAVKSLPMPGFIAGPEDCGG